MQDSEKTLVLKTPLGFGLGFGLYWVFDFLFAVASWEPFRLV